MCLISCQTATNKYLPIIDMHMHSYPVEYMGGSNIPNPVTGRPSGAVSDEELYAGNSVRDAPLQHR